MKIHMLPFLAIILLASSCPALAANKDKCVFNFQPPLIVRSMSGKFNSNTVIQKLDTNRSELEVGHARFDLQTCRNDQRWHCISGAGFKLFMPRQLTAGVNEWSYGKYNYRFMEKVKYIVGDATIEFRPLAVYIKNKNTDLILSTYFFDEKSNLIGYADYVNLQPNEVGEINTTPLNYWLLGREAPLNCY